MSGFEYKAFITYSHADDKVAAWLQRSLESFRVPSRLVGSEVHGGTISRRIGKVFRDREELSAGDNLSQHLHDALAKSEFLIVVCSPSARNSRWVNLEIEQFRHSHPEDKILCLIANGEPSVSGNPDLDHLECYPEALGYTQLAGSTGAEPIAADVRSSGDGKRLAKLKIVSALLGIKLDELIQRDAQRRLRNLGIAATASAAGMMLFAFLSIIAIEARNSEEIRRSEAEDLIEFMLSDLRDRLEEVGRLDVLDAVGDKAVEYYSSSLLSEYSQSSLGRRARAFHLLGEVDDLKGDLESARNAFDEAYQSTAELLARNENNTDRIYEHAQSVFWIGYLEWRLGNLHQAEGYFQQYMSLAEQGLEIEPDNQTWQLELGNAAVNLGVYFHDEDDFESALSYFEQAQSIYSQLSTQSPTDSEIRWLLAQSSAGLADTNRDLGDLNAAMIHRADEIRIYEALKNINSADQDINLSLLTAHQAMARLLVQSNRHEEALLKFQEAGVLGEELRALDPENTFVASEVAKNYLSMSRVLATLNQMEEANLLFNAAQTIVADLLDLNANVEEWIDLDSEIREAGRQLFDQ